MKTLPPAPVPGEKIRATFFRDLLDYVRYITPIEGPNVRFSRGPNGTRISCSAKTSHASSIPPRPFDIKSVTLQNEGARAVMLFDHPYVQVGNTFKVLSFASGCSITIDAGEGDEDPDDEDNTSIFLALKISSTVTEAQPSIAKYSEDDFVSESAEIDYSLIPLYLVSTTSGSLGSVLCDLRDIPTSVQFEG